MQEENFRGQEKRTRGAFLLSTPMIVWTLAFVGATILYIIVLSFLKRDPDGFGVIWEFTLENYAKLLDANYGKVFWSTIVLGVNTTLRVVIIFADTSSSFSTLCELTLNRIVPSPGIGTE